MNTGRWICLHMSRKTLQLRIGAHWNGENERLESERRELKGTVGWNSGAALEQLWDWEAEEAVSLQEEGVKMEVSTTGPVLPS